MTIKIPNGRKIDQMATKYTNIFHCKTFLPKFIYPNWDFWFAKYTIWQPCLKPGRRGFSWGWPKFGAEKCFFSDPLISRMYQGCQMVCFQTKNPNLGKFWRALEWKMLLYFMIIWNILWPFGIFKVIWCILWSFGIFFPFWYAWTEKNLAAMVCTFSSSPFFRHFSGLINRDQQGRFNGRFNST
jgi:hypothetical protein